MKKLLLASLLLLFIGTTCSAVDILVKNMTQKNWNLVVEAKGKFIGRGSVGAQRTTVIKNMPYDEMLAIQATARGVGKAIGGDSSSGRPLVSSGPETIRKNVISNVDSFTIVINECTTSDPDCRSITNEKADWETRECRDDMSYYLETEDL